MRVKPANLLALVLARKCPRCGSLGNDWPAGLVVAAAPDRADGEASYLVRILAVAGAGAAADQGAAVKAAGLAAVTALRAGGAGAAALAEEEQEWSAGETLLPLFSVVEVSVWRR